MEQNKVIYFDNAATTDPLNEVIEEYISSLHVNYANASSAHFLGEQNNRELENARDSILKTLNLKDHQVIFTSGATEANNLALKGFMRRNKSKGNHLIVSCVEHPSILLTAKELESEGFKVSYLPVNNEGKVTLYDLSKAITKDTILVSIMAVNNEVGAVNEISNFADYIHKNHPGVVFHVDAAQAIGKVNLPFNDIDMLTISLHKIGGLKSSGLFIKRNKLNLDPLFNGGGQENGLRSGTNDVAMAKADALALRLAINNFKNYDYIFNLVKPLYDYLNKNKNLYEINSSLINPYILNFSFLKKKGSVMREALSNLGIMVATKSACSSKLNSSSPTLLNMGKNKLISENAIRLSFSIRNTKEEIDYFISCLDKLNNEVRG